MSITAVPVSVNPVATAAPLLLKDAGLLVTQQYLPMEAGWALNADGMWHVAGSTYMKDVTGAMVDWWFGYVTTTDQYKQWHPKDHVDSKWVGPHGNSTYIGGNHLVHEYIGGVLQQLRIQFHDPSEYFGANWKTDFKNANVSTAVCGKVGLWEGRDDANATDIGHLIHLVHDEFDGVRMRSRFWLGDIEGITDPLTRANGIPDFLPPGLTKHTTEEMAILSTFLPGLYKEQTGSSSSKPHILPWMEGSGYSLNEPTENSSSCPSSKAKSAPNKSSGWNWRWLFGKKEDKEANEK